jgi:hypothetical protein
MLNHIVPLVVGVKYYQSECKKTLPTIWLMTHLEAFALLCLNNYYHNVEDTAGNKITIWKPKWTSEGIHAKRASMLRETKVGHRREYQSLTITAAK